MTRAKDYSAKDLYKIAKLQRRMIRVVLASLLLVSGIIAAHVFTHTAVVTEMSSEETGVPKRIEYHSNLSGQQQLGLALLTVVSCGAAAVWWFVTFVQLLKALHTHFAAALVLFIGSFVPLVSIVILGFVVMRSSRALRRAGYRAGLLGASRRVLDDLKQKIIPVSMPLPAAAFRISPRVE